MKTTFIHTGLLLTSLFLFGQCTSQQEELVIWIGGAPQEVNFWESLVNDFEKQTGYNVKFIRQPTDSELRRQALVISLEAGQPNPDLFLIDVIWIKQFVQSGWLEPLDKFISSSAYQTGIFFQNIAELVNKYEGKFYTLPVFMDVALLYYREDLLKKFGLNPPSTWSELLSHSIKIQQEEKRINRNFSGFVWQGAQYEGLVCNFLEYAASNGGGIMQNDDFNLTSDQNIEALQFMQDLIHRYKVSPQNIYTEMKEEEVRSAFQRGNALFERNWTYVWNLHNSSDSFVKGKTGLKILPHFDNFNSVSTLGGWSIALSKFSDSKDKAWEFMQFATSYEVQKKMVTDLGWNPGRRDLYNDKEILEALPHFRELEEVFEHVVSRPDIAYYPQVSAVIQRFVNNCLAGKMEPAEALEKIQDETERLSALYQPDK